MTAILVIGDAFAWTLAFLLFWPILAVGMVGIIPRDRAPAAAIAWLLAIGLIPVVGFLAFMVFGNTRLPRSRAGPRRRLDQEIVEGYTAIVNTGGARPPGPSDEAGRRGPLQRLVRSHGGLPAVGGNRIRIFDDYQGSIQAMADAVHEAKSYVHVQFYTLAVDAETEPFLQALEEAHVLGVKVRVLFDHHGSRSRKGHEKLIERLDASGIEWYRVLPVKPFSGRFSRPDLRNHRKLLVVDGTVGFTGSQNMIDRSYHTEDEDGSTHEFIDIMARMEGPVVQQLDAVFRSDWYAEAGSKPDEMPLAMNVEPEPGHDCQLVPSGPGHPFENVLRLSNALLYHARKKAVLVSPYIVPDHSLMMAITSAAARGVQVQVITCERGDQRFLNYAQRSYYRQLLDAGVELYTYPHPQVLHSKSITIDDDLALMGSSNLDMRSFHLNLEACVMIYDRDVVRQLRAIEAGYLRRAQRVEVRQWESRPVSQRMLSRAARLTAALQ